MIKNINSPSHEASARQRKTCPFCKIMGEGTRAKIIKQLKGKPKNVSEIVKKFSLRQPTISHHLKFLQKAGLVLSKKQGREIYYYINKKHPCGKC